MSLLQLAKQWVGFSYLTARQPKWISVPMMNMLHLFKFNATRNDATDTAVDNAKQTFKRVSFYVYTVNNEKISLLLLNFSTP